MKSLFIRFAIILSLATIFGCGNKLSRLEEKLRRTINESERGRLKARIENRAGFKVEIDHIEFKETFKEDYTYIAVVTFRRKDVAEEARQVALPKLGDLPTTDQRAGKFQVRFRYLEVEDRWYFEQFVQ